MVYNVHTPIQCSHVGIHCSHANTMFICFILFFTTRFQRFFLIFSEIDSVSDLEDKLELLERDDSESSSNVFVALTICRLESALWLDEMVMLFAGLPVTLLLEDAKFPEFSVKYNTLDTCFLSASCVSHATLGVKGVHRRSMHRTMSL